MDFSLGFRIGVAVYWNCFSRQHYQFPLLLLTPARR